MSRDELRVNPVVRGWLTSIAKGDAETEAVLLGALQDAIDAGETLKSVDLVGLAKEALGEITEDEITEDEITEDEITEDEITEGDGEENDAEKERKTFSWAPVLGQDKIPAAIAAIPGHCDVAWKAEACLDKEMALTRPRKKLVAALVKHHTEVLGVELPGDLAGRVDAMGAKKPKRLTRAAATLAAAAEGVAEPEEAEAKADVPKPTASSRWSAPAHSVRFASGPTNAWLLPRPDGNAMALVRIRKFDGNKVGIFRVEDAGFKMPEKASDLTYLDAIALVKLAKEGVQIALEGNKAATDILKAKITEAGAEFPAAVAA